MSETVEFRCPHCGQMYRLAAEQLARRAGRLSVCRKCQQKFAFPALPPDEQDPPAEQEAPQYEAEPEAPSAQQPQVQQEYQQEPPYEMPAQEQPQYEQPPDQAAEYPPPAAPSTLSYARAPARRPAPSPGDYLAFRAMVTPLVIQIVFWVVVGLEVLGALTIIAKSISGGMEPALLIGGVVLLLVGPLATRLWCEWLIVIFRIHDCLEAIERRLSERQ